MASCTLQTGISLGGESCELDA